MTIERFKKFKRKDLILTIMLMPTLFSIFIYRIAPSVVLVIAFKDLNTQKGILNSEWVGLENFEYLFSRSFGRILFNTITYNLIFIFLITFLSLFIAYGLRQLQSPKIVTVILTLFMLPSLLSWIMVSYISRALFDGNGLLNSVLAFLHKDPVNWYTDKNPWRVIIIIAYLWKNAGFYILLYYSAMSSIKKEFIYASSVDGASKITCLFRIYIPLISKTISIILLFSLADVLTSDFGLFYNLPRDSGMLYPVTDVIDTYMYRGLRSGNFEISAAANFIQSLGGLVFVALIYSIRKMVKKSYE